MDFRILGPLEVRDGDREVRLRGGKQRALLALLLVNANRTLAIDRIVDDLWGEDVPETAAKMVQIYVSRLRKALPAGALHTRPPGYAIQVEPGELDLHRFEGLVAEARSALDAGEAEESSRGFRSALELWRGPALAEFASEPFAPGEGARLEELRLSALEGRLEADLLLGRHGEVAGELEALIARYPLREGFRRQHMLALYRSGRHAEALAGYQSFRRTLADELGIEPSAALRDLERRILRQDPSLEPAPARRAEGDGARAGLLGDVGYARSDDVRIAYQVVGDGPIDLVLVHGWVCTFQPGWEYPRLAAFYRRLASLGRLILFDKRGTGLSDRVSPDRLPDLETRMDDVRAVLDAAGSERAALLGISEGGALSTLFAATHPARTAALVLLGTFAREMRAPDHPWGVSDEDLRQRLALLDEDDWASAATRDWLGRVAPGVSRDAEALQWYTSYVRRGASPGAAKALRLMNAEIDIRELLPTISVPTLVLHRAHESWRDGSRFMGERIPGARMVELPGDIHLPWEGDAESLLDEIERFLSELGEAVEPDRVLATLLSLKAAAGAGTADLRKHDEVIRSELARFRGRAVLGPGDELLAAFDGPARAVRCAAAIVRALGPAGRAVRAGVHTGEVEMEGDIVRGVAVDIAACVAAEASPGEVLVSQTVKDLVAGSGLELADRGSRAFDGVPGEWRLLAVVDADRHVAAGGRQDEMLKLVTVLVADVVEPDARGAARHPEDVRDLMADFFGAMAAEIESEGGTIERFAGEAIMAVFGVPTVHEDDAVRAVRAARRMVERLRSWNDAREPAQALELRIGVSTGEALASGAAGDDLRVTGDAVTLAARLQQAAEPGTIVIAERTARAARPSFELRAIEEPNPAWLVVGEREPFDAPAIAAPLVGRDHELAFLRTTYDRVCRERRQALVTVVGDAGVGKSRLVREFLAPLEGRAKMLAARCLPSLQGVTLEPLAGMLKDEAGVLETDPADEAFAKIVRLVGSAVDPELAADRSRTAAALASTLGLRPPGDPLGSLDPRELYRELVGAWLALLASLGRRGAVVAVVEDLHWADPTLLDVLDELAERLDGAVLFLCTTRPDLVGSRPNWGGGRRSFSSLPLDPLSADETARLASFLPGVDELPAGVRRLILERSGGNPFFLEEIVRRLIDDGLLVREGERWAAGAGIAAVEIPDNVQAVILARLDLLGPDERRVAQRAAVVGRVFWDGALARLVDVADLDTALETLRRREFLRERLSSSLPGQREFLFKHVLIRDVAYASLPRAERGRAHAETAAWIEETAGRTDETAEQLAHHYDAAFSLLGDDELRRKARAQLLAGAANAHRRFAIKQGDRLARRAVELSEGGAERVEALEALGDLHSLSFHGDAAWRTYGDALAELSDGDPGVARLAWKATLPAVRFVGSMHDVPDIEAVREVIELGLRAAPTPGRERTLLLLNRGFLVRQRESRDDADAEAAVREAEAAAEELGDADVLSVALDLVQIHEDMAGRRGESYRTSLRRVGLISRLNDVTEIGDTYSVAARSALFVGRPREAEARATAGVERARGIDSGSYIHALTWRVAARFALGEWQDALTDQDELERVVALAPREHPPPFTLGAYTRIALCHELRGEHEDAGRYIEQGLWIVEWGGFERARGRSIHLPPLALALARRGRLEDALDLIPLVPRSVNAGMTLEALCEIAAMRERWDEAAGLVAAAREEADVGEQLSLPLHADRLEGRAAAARGDIAEAAGLLRRSAEGFAALEARWEEAWSRLLLGEVLAHTDSKAAEVELGAALPVFERLGSVREAELALAVLDTVAPAAG
jgi:class 3 adenylate cyclase/DNA-binding SARP family transcriptional activator/pimeloyl-ACP methyl ester carboxylesterase/tetratricopeptide (TPR) repeat protein